MVLICKSKISLDLIYSESHKFQITPPSQWLEAEVKFVKGNCSLPHPRSLLLLATSYPPFLNKTEPLKNTCLVMFEMAINLKV